MAAASRGRRQTMLRPHSFCMVRGARASLPEAADRGGMQVMKKGNYIAATRMRKEANISDALSADTTTFQGQIREHFAIVRANTWAKCRLSRTASFVSAQRCLKVSL
eukprot:CAMPEP_0171094298 /NCGR_PEP_ID=MMETSP0766_2-20121228/40635_1 /TAXON_ID=439317 /ORGANISM="Gambierdiscus australes, Strain CAWD 149" /LENGTH=106 /DNA_ID=CAMNT_0011552905 /DNA_START=49 /DNA_END=368 /DNA_ORIENTATION=+